MAIVVTLPAEAPTNIGTTLVSGGTLESGTTYYYVMFCQPTIYNSPANSSRYAYHSPVSEEGSFETTETERSVSFTWDKITGTTLYYNFLLSTTSGDYTNSRIYGGTLESINAAINQDTTSYLVSDVGDNIYIKHSVQLVNGFVGDIPKETGTLKVYFDDASSTTWDIEDVYDAVVAAGYSAYTFYDGYTFILKGWIIVDAVSTGHLVVESKNLIFIKGGVHNWSTTFITRFGRWTDAVIGANYSFGCDIDIQHSRYPFRGGYDTFQVYGCQVSAIKSRKTDFTENLNVAYYNNGSQQYQAYSVSEIKDNILGVSLRSNTGDVVDLKFGQGNNFGNYNHIRCRITAYANLPYYAGGKFYACKWLSGADLRVYGGHFESGYYCNFYDNEFPNYTDGEVNVGDIYYTMTGLVCDRHEDFFYTIKFTVLDDQGVGIENVNVNCTNVSGNTVTWIEKDGSYDQLVSGNEYSSDVQTNSGGTIDYYVKSYKFFIEDQAEIITPNYDLTKEIYYPFIVTFSKEGYTDYSLKITRLSDIFQGVITLPTAVTTKVTTKGNVVLLSNPELGVNSQFFEI